MALLILGMILFLASHSLTIFAYDWRQRQIARLGEKPWKGIMSVLALISFALMVWGFGQARQDPIILYQPPFFLRHIAIALTYPAILLIAAANIPGTILKAKIGHPMVAGVKLWAFAHLLANGGAHDVVLFGGLLIWSVVSFASNRRRDRRLGVTYPPATLRGNLILLVAGTAFWALFALVLHLWLIGVAPLA